MLGSTQFGAANDLANQPRVVELKVHQQSNKSIKLFGRHEPDFSADTISHTDSNLTALPESEESRANKVAKFISVTESGKSVIKELGLTQSAQRNESSEIQHQKGVGPYQIHNQKPPGQTGYVFRGKSEKGNQFHNQQGNPPPPSPPPAAPDQTDANEEMRNQSRNGVPQGNPGNKQETEGKTCWKWEWMIARKCLK